MREPRRWSALLGSMLMVVALVGCAETHAPRESEATEPATWRLASFEEETITREGTTPLVVERGMIEVPAVRGDAASGTIAVEIFRFRRQPDAPADTPPVFYLKGGPGFEGMQPLLERPGYFENTLASYLEVSDLVIIGQRGFGTSTDTRCPDATEVELPPTQWLDSDARARALHEASSRCRDHWIAAGVDLTAFNVSEAAADVRDVAAALGYQQILVWGSSFGAHWGMVVVRDHPEIVARAIFNALEGPDHTYDMPSGILSSLEGIAAEAETSPAYRDRLPEGGLWAGFARQVARAEAEPITVTVAHPETGVETPVTFNADAIRDLARGYRTRPIWRDLMPRWLPDLYAVATGDLAPAARAVLNRGGWVWPGAAAKYIYDCGSGISPARDAVRRADPAIAVIGQLESNLDAACSAWNSDLGADFRSDFETDTPTVLIHGTWDIGTPYQNALEVEPFFANGHLVTVEGGSHGAIFEAVDLVDGFKDALWHFAKTGDASRLPARVTLPPLDWSTP